MGKLRYFTYMMSFVKKDHKLILKFQYWFENVFEIK